MQEKKVRNKRERSLIIQGTFSFLLNLNFNGYRISNKIFKYIDSPRLLKQDICIAFFFTFLHLDSIIIRLKMMKGVIIEYGF